MGEREEMGLYERLREERAGEEERRRRRPLSIFYGSDSPVLDRRLADAPKHRPPGYRHDLLHRYIKEGVRGKGAARRFAGLRRRYPKEHAELNAEARGQGELL